MKATLTITVPDEWDKGFHRTCPFGTMRYDNTIHTFIYVCFVHGDNCNQKNCPLEIKENTDETN